MQTSEHEPELKFFQGSGLRLAYFDWGQPLGRPVIFFHATGFHARCWDEVIRLLPPGLHVLAAETRGHGRTEKTGPITDWRQPADDMVDWLQHLNIEGAIGIGHSMGGHILVQAMAANPALFAKAILLDPVIMSPEAYKARLAALPEDFVHPVAKRRNAWNTWQDMEDIFKRRHPYSLWRPKVLEDYCRYGVQPKSGGEGVELACPPAIEASIYMASTGSDILQALPAISAEVIVVRAQQRPPGERNQTDFTGSPTWDQLASRFRNGRDIFRPDLTHFIPMQDPQFVANLIVSP